MVDKKQTAGTKPSKVILQTSHLITAFDIPEQDYDHSFLSRLLFELRCLKFTRQAAVKQHYKMSYEPKEFCRFCT